MEPEKLQCPWAGDASRQAADDRRYMRRALALAERGRGYVAPNPMVGAVIVGADGAILGEGWHREYGHGHAEVNAVASCGLDPARIVAGDPQAVAQARHRLAGATIYVTLEPCSHYGKTPPCALLLERCGFGRVVAATVDPNPKVAGRGLQKLREAGAEVTTGVLEEEARRLNREFFTAQILGRPLIALKWAQSSDGYMDRERTAEHPQAARFSTPLTGVLTHQMRARNMAILTTGATFEADRPQLTLRHYAGRQPQRIVAEGHIDNLEQYFASLWREQGISSVLVEAGPRFLSALLEAGLWDTLRVEISPTPMGSCGRHPAPPLPGIPLHELRAGSNRLLFFENPAAISGS